jgi:TIR domain
VSIRRLARPDRRPPPLRIFISYRRQDASAYAGRLYDAISARFGAKNVFMDVDTIGPGSDFYEAIDGAMASCDVVIALIGRQWLSATDPEGKRRLDDPEDVLRVELERALAHGLVVIPARVQDAELPSAAELPSSLAPIARRQAIELRDTAWRDDVARLLRSLDRLADEAAGETAGGEPAPSPALAPNRTRRRNVWLGVAAAALLAAVAAALAIALRDGSGSDGDDSSQSPSAAQSGLLDVIPAALRPGCDPVDPDPESAVASISCSGANLTAIYSVFDDSSVMRAAYELAREDAEVEPETGECSEDGSSGEAPYVVDGEEVGRYFCYLNSDQPHLVWTDTRATVAVDAYVSATGQDAVDSLRRQWNCCLQLTP